MTLPSLGTSVVERYRMRTHNTEPLGGSGGEYWKEQTVDLIVQIVSHNKFLYGLSASGTLYKKRAISEVDYYWEKILESPKESTL